MSRGQPGKNLSCQYGKPELPRYHRRFKRTTNSPTNQNSQTITGKSRHLVKITLNANGINSQRKRC